jgi:predicted nucleic acid-binding protein
VKICIDSGFLFALYSPKDEHHLLATGLFKQLFDHPDEHIMMVIVWPVLYESLNTKFAKNRVTRNRVSRDLEELLWRNQLGILSDVAYREKCLEELLTSELERPLSLVDRVIREALADDTTGIDGIITFNPGDFQDICAGRSLRLINHSLT